MLVKEYRKILSEISSEALSKARAQVSVLKIEEKAWELLGRPDIWERKHAIQIQLDKVTREKMELSTGSCTGESSAFEKALAESKEQTIRLSWEKIGRLDLYDKDLNLRNREKAIVKERKALDAETSAFKTRDGYYDGYSNRPYDLAYKAIKETEHERAWASLGREDLTAKEKDLNKQLGEISDEEKPYNGNVCEMKRRIDRSFFERHVPEGYKSPLDEARWQAKQLLYPQEDEVLEARRKADQELVLAGVPEKVGDIVETLRKTFDSILK
jgi:hypothetical protein